VAAKPFFFSLELSSQGASAELLGHLARQVLEHVGASTKTLPELTQSLQQAVTQGAVGANRRCDVQFRAQADKVEIVVSSNGGRIWQTSLPIT
jgi:hypothetical protein